MCCFALIFFSVVVTARASHRRCWFRKRRHVQTPDAPKINWGVIQHTNTHTQITHRTFSVEANNVSMLRLAVHKERKNSWAWTRTSYLWWCSADVLGERCLSKSASITMYCMFEHMQGCTFSYTCFRYYDIVTEEVPFMLIYEYNRAHRVPRNIWKELHSSRTCYRNNEFTQSRQHVQHVRVKSQKYPFKRGCTSIQNEGTMIKVYLTNRR